MKDGTEYATRLRRLCHRVKRHTEAPRDLEGHDPTTELILACLAARTTESRARYALSRLQHSFVDYNELRVARPEDITEILGKTFPGAREAAVQITGLLQEIYDERDSLDLEHLKEAGKREAKLYLQGLKHASDYVISRVMLGSLGAHAFPVNESMLAMLQAEEVVDPQAPLAEVQGFLERHISARQVRKTFALLTWYAEHYRSAGGTGKGVSGRKPASRKRASRKKTTKKKKVAPGSRRRSD